MIKNCLILGTLAFAGCGGGSSQYVGNFPPAIGQSKAGSTSLVRATIVVPMKHSAASARTHRAYVPPALAGLVVRVDQIVKGVASEYSDTGYALSATLSTQSTSDTCVAVSQTSISCTITFVAPVTDANDTDAFYLYGYDSPQTVGTLSPSYVPKGSLIAQDIGSGNGEPVPGQAGGPNASGILPAQNSVLAFTLDPIVAKAMPVVAGVTTTSATPIVLSVPGSGGVSNTLSVGATDADGTVISSYLAGNGDDTFVNPITASVSPNAFAVSAPSITQVNEPITVSFNGAAAYAPSSPTANAFEAIVSLAASFTGGFHDTSAFPESTTTVSVAPLFAVAQAFSTNGQTGYDIYAVQAELPTGVTGSANYSLAIAGIGNDCPYALTTFSAAAGNQRAAFEIDYTGSSASTIKCSFVLSDGLVQTLFSLSPPAQSAATTHKRGNITL